jgi:hypothetical protein
MTSRAASCLSLSRLKMISLATVLASLGTFAVAELQPARPLGPLANAPALTHMPSRADVDYAYHAFEPFRDSLPPDPGRVRQPDPDNAGPLAAIGRIRI